MSLAFVQTKVECNRALGEKRGGGALRRFEMRSDGKGGGGECDGRTKGDLQAHNEE